MRCCLIRALSLASLGCVIGLVGCGKQTASQAVDTVLQKTGGSRDAVFPLAGKITIDGHEPHLNPSVRMFVMLHDPARLDASKGPLFKAVCKPNGQFAFNTYIEGDGVPAGKYVVTIVQFRQGFHRGYLGGDSLKNLYNDPDANSKLDEFVINHQAPGKTDNAFDLQIEGREPGVPGPHAVTKIGP